MDWGDTKAFTTPEQVSITYSLAGIGTRFAAVSRRYPSAHVGAAPRLPRDAPLGLGVDTLVGDLFGGDLNLPGWMLPVLPDPVFLVFWGYFMFWETVWNGQTPGKRVCGIRVMRDGGFPIDFRAAFLRNIVRYVDFLPAFYGVGAVTMFMSKDSKRLGDYAAGTIVVIDARQPAAVPAKPAASAAPRWPPLRRHRRRRGIYRVLGDPALLSLRALTRDQFLVVERFLDRREELAGEGAPRPRPPDRHPPHSPHRVCPPQDGFPYEDFLIELAIAYRNRPGV